MTDIVMGFVTCKNREEASKISKALLENKLVSCCNLVPGIESLYWWKGKIEEAHEMLIVLKTMKGNEEGIIRELKALHSYEVPAVEFLDVSGGSKEYLEWIKKETGEEK